MTEKNKGVRSEIFYIGLTVLLIIFYIIIDGLSMISTSMSSLRGGSVISFADESYEAGVHSVILQQYIARIFNLFFALFPIVFLSLRCHVSFDKDQSSVLKRIMPFFRAFLGLILFYYVLNYKTSFLHEVFTNYYSFGNWSFFFRIIGAFFIFGAFIVDWIKCFGFIKKFPNAHPNITKFIFIIVVSLCSCMLMEFQIGSKMNMLTYMLFYNVLYWFILQVLIDLLTRNVKIGAIFSLLLSFLIGLINDVVFQFRGNYVMFGDLTVVRTALEVAGNYTYKPSVWFWSSLLILVVSVCFTVFIKVPRNDRITSKEIAIRIVSFTAIVIAVYITFCNGMLYNNVFGLGWDYNSNVKHIGYMPYFLSNMNSITKVELDGYDAQMADAALDATFDVSPDTCNAPNIIIIQNEAFADLSVLYDIETNQDYMPYIHSLTDNTQKGYLNMSITGGPTANTEFEVLMRSTLSFLPYGCVPYTQYINADLPSVPMMLKNQSTPYHTVAYHPYYSAGYSRTNVYTHFGFDEMVFENDFRSDFPESELPRGYLSDLADYRRVEELYENYRSTSNDPWFCFNVTIQNHGGYTQTFVPTEDNRVYVTNFEAPESLNSYLSLIKTSDEAFRELIEYFSACEEPTIIAMYGDHQPSLNNDALDVLSDYTGDQVNNYYVPYVIWANFDIEEVNTLGDAEHEPVLNTLSTNYFASYVFYVAGIELSDYDRYLLDLHESVPAITAIGVWDADGNYYSSIDSCPFYDEISLLRMVQYNLIFDDDGRLTEHYI